MLDILENTGYRKCRKQAADYHNADRLYQKRLRSKTLDTEFYINAWVYDPSDYSPERTIEFEFQLDSDEVDSDFCTRVKFFSIKELDFRKLQDIEEKAVNIYNYVDYA